MESNSVQNGLVPTTEQRMKTGKRKNYAHKKVYKLEEEASPRFHNTIFIFISLAGRPSTRRHLMALTKHCGVDR